MSTGGAGRTIPNAGAVTALRLIILLRVVMRRSLRNRREHNTLSHRRLGAWPLPVMLAKIVLIDVDYKAAPLLSFSLQQHRVDGRRREWHAAFVHDATLSKLGRNLPQ
jgi:hypothetical protein